jgi:hypothetical protein
MDPYLLFFTKTKQNKNNNTPATPEEIRFYRHRILDLSKRILIDQLDDNCMPLDIIDSFHQFIKQSIAYFHYKDKSESIQKDLSLDIINVEQPAALEPPPLELPLYPTQPKLTYFDKTVKISKKPVRAQTIFPVSKVLNITEPEFRKKGLLNNNLDNEYETSDIQIKDEDEEDEEDKKRDISESAQEHHKI